MKIAQCIILFVICSFDVKASAIENEPSDSLVVLEIKNENLRPILDSMIYLEKKCKYYNSQLLFDIKVQPTAKYYSNIQVEAIGFKPRGRKYVGCFYYGGHIFLVSGQFDNSLFRKTTKNKSIKRERKKNKFNQIIIDEDSYSSCLYKYQNNKFTLIGRLSYCK